MTFEEAQQRIDGLSPREKHTFERVKSAHDRLRAKFMGTTTRISRAAVAAEYGGRSVGIASKYMGLIEALDTQMRENSAEPRAEGAPATDHSPTVQRAFEALRSAVEAVSAAVIEAHTAFAAGQAAHYAALLEQQRAVDLARVRGVEERNADLEAASFAAGDELETMSATLDEIREALKATTLQYEETAAQAKAMGEALEIERARLAGAESQIAILERANATLATELSHRREERELLASAGARIAQLDVENAQLREQASSANWRTTQVEARLAEMDERHASEREALHAAHGREIAAERQRAFLREARLLDMVAVVVDQAQIRAAEGDVQ